jgi:hypothetical protein
MVAYGMKAPLSWRGISQLVHRDAGLWCRDIQVDACYRMLLVLSGLNQRYFTRFQVKRMRQVAAKLAMAPSNLAERIEALLAAPPRAAFDALHGLEGEVLELVARHMPDVDLEPARTRWAAYSPD